MWYHCSGFVTIGLRMRRDSCKVQHCQHTATHCNTLQHTATHCSTLKRTTTRCNTLKHTGAACTMGLPQYVQNSGTHTAINSRNTLHHTAIYCNTPRIFEHFQNKFYCSVANTHKMAHLCMSFPTKAPNNWWLICGQRPVILWVFDTIYKFGQGALKLEAGLREETLKTTHFMCRCHTL